MKPGRKAARESKKRARLARGCGILPQGSFQENGRILGDRAPAAIGLSLKRWICLMAASRRGRRSYKPEMAAIDKSCGSCALAAIGPSLKGWICLMAASRRGRRSYKLEVAPGEATPSGLKC